jgi:integrase/recombinase XerC
MQLHGQGLPPVRCPYAVGLAGLLSLAGQARRGAQSLRRSARRSGQGAPALPIDQTALLDALASAVEVRDKAMFELFYSSGLRLAELVGLDLGGNLDLAEGTVTVTGKRGKTRVVPLGAKAAAAIRTWLERRSTLAAADEAALFVGRRGNRLNPRTVERRLDAWAKKAGVGLHVHPHMLHSFASHLLQSSGDLRAVQEMLGHANIGTTQIYTHLDFQHLTKVYDAAHPRAKMKAGK